jgi:hypothetical protein
MWFLSQSKCPICPYNFFIKVFWSCDYISYLQVQQQTICSDAAEAKSKKLLKSPDAARSK